MNLESIKKNIEASVLFAEYIEDFIVWVEKNINNKDATWNFTDRWTVPNNPNVVPAESEFEPVEEKEELEYATFRIEYMFLSNMFPYMKVTYKEERVYAVTIRNDNLEIWCANILPKIEKD